MKQKYIIAILTVVIIILSIILIVISTASCSMVSPVLSSMRNRDSYWKYEFKQNLKEPNRDPNPNEYDPKDCLLFLDLHHRLYKFSELVPDTMIHIGTFNNGPFLRLRVWKSKQYHQYYIVFGGCAPKSGDDRRCTHYNLISPYEDEPNIKVHQGFYECFEEDYKIVLENFVEQYPDVLDNKNTIYLAGQSLGSIQAMFSAIYLKGKGANDIRMFTFASSRIGNIEMVNKINNACTEYFNFLNTEDLFCNMPMAIMPHYRHQSRGLGYYHAGIKVIWLTMNEESICANHSTKTYIKLMNKELENH